MTVGVSFGVSISTFENVTESVYTWHNAEALPQLFAVGESWLSTLPKGFLS